MKIQRATPWILCLLLTLSSALPIIAAEPQDQAAQDEAEELRALKKVIDELLSTITPEDLKSIAEYQYVPPKAADVAALRKAYEGKPLDLLLAIRNGRAEQAGQLIQELTVADGRQPDAWGSWKDLDVAQWREYQPVEIYDLDDASVDLFKEATLQAAVANDPAVWSVLRPILERLVADFVTDTGIKLTTSTDEFEKLLPHIDLNAPIIAYRFKKSTVVPGPAVCFLAMENSLVDPTLEVLLEAGANPNIQCLDEWTPLFHAIARIGYGKISILLNHKANPNTKINGLSPLAFVEESSLNEGHKREINKLLIQNGATR